MLAAAWAVALSGVAADVVPPTLAGRTIYSADVVPPTLAGRTIYSADVVPPTLAGRTIYFAMVDRFARADDNATGCSGAGQWCGGSLKGLASRLDYIAGMGFDCVWITPVSKQIEGVSCNAGGYCGTGYHGYWAEDWYAVDAHLGTSADLAALSAALHGRGMCLVLDIVVNHVRPLHHARDVGRVRPFNSTAFYHTFNATAGESFEQYVGHPASAFPAAGCRLGELSCPGYNQTAVLEGWFADLGDLRQEDPHVHAELLAWAGHMVRTYGVDGLRLDTAPYVPTDFLAALQREVRVDILGEVTARNLSFHAGYQRAADGSAVLSGLLNFPLADALPAAFCAARQGPQTSEGAAPDLRPLAAVVKRQAAPDTPYASLDPPPHPVPSCPILARPVPSHPVPSHPVPSHPLPFPPLPIPSHPRYASLDLLANFADNHDGERIGRQCGGDASRVAHALSFVMLSRGIPVVYYGTEQAFEQADQRASLWQTSYATDTPLYALLANLSRSRREIDPVGDASLLHADAASLVFSRAGPPPGRRRAFVFLNNANASSAASPRAYCLPAPAQLPPVPAAGQDWFDALTGRPARFDRPRGCFLAASHAPHVLVLRG